MSRRVPRPRNAPWAARVLVVAMAAVALVAGMVTPAVTASAQTVAGQTVAGGSAAASIAPASLQGFNPGNIISDAVFFDSTTMTAGQIQSFFNAKVPTCRAGYICLKDARQSTPNRAADAYCKGYAGAPNETAATIIVKAAQSCGINPQVLVVMLQKEQGLVTHTWPSQWRYDMALGQGCPDTAPCDPAYAGFFYQIYGAARQMQIYAEGKWFAWYAPGKTWNILYHPNSACGRGAVHISNTATAALYYYTPYQPNPAALRAGYGEGDGCSSYGNRNFYNYFTDWFGSTQVAQFTATPITVEGRFSPGQVVQAKVSFTPTPASTAFQWYRNGQAIAGATSDVYRVGAADGGTNIDVSVTASSPGYTPSTQRSSASSVRSVAVQRIYGASREETAVAVSRVAWPSGARTVFLATSADYADALGAAAAAGKAEASLLLTASDSLSAPVVAELKRLAPARVILMGGEGVLTPGVSAAVAAAVPSAALERVSGPDRYATSRAMVEWAGVSASLLVATGRDFPDALSAAAIGSSTGSPVLLVDGMAGSLDAATMETLTRAGIGNVTIVGGPGVVSDGISSHFGRLGISVQRVSGADRYQTNAEANNRFFGATALRVLVAAGADFPDALSASVLAGRWKVPMLLSESTCFARSSAEFIRTRNSESVYLIGGPGVLNEEGVAQLRSCA